MSNPKSLLAQLARRLAPPMTNPNRSVHVIAHGNTAAEIDTDALQQGRAFFGPIPLFLSAYHAVYTSPKQGDLRTAGITVHDHNPSTSTGPAELWTSLPWYGKASLALTALNGVAFGIMLVLVVAA